MLKNERCAVMRVGFARATPWPPDGRSKQTRETRINDLAGGIALFFVFARLGWLTTDTLGLKEMRAMQPFE